MLIKTITAQEVLDSRGIPTVVGCVTLEDGTIGSASFRLAHQRVNGKRLNCGTETRSDMAARDA